MKKITKALYAVTAGLLAMSLMGCPKMEDPIDPVEWDTEKIEIGDVNWDEHRIDAKLLKAAKPGARLHIVAEDNTDDGGNSYCKIYLMNTGWNDCGVTQAFYEGGDTNKLAYEEGASEGNPYKRPYMSSDGTNGASGEFYFVLSEDALKENLMISGFGKIKKCWIEYVDGKKDVPKTPELIAWNEADFVITTAATAEGAAKLVLKYNKSEENEVTGESGSFEYSIDESTTITNLELKISVVKAGKTVEEKEEYSFKSSEVVIAGNIYSPGYEAKLPALPNVILEVNDQVKIEVVSATFAPESNNTKVEAIFVDDTEAANFSTPCVDWGKTKKIFAPAAE